MAGGKQTPRQRMMGILYLVLLGLIALDVPDSLLDAFKSISDSLSASKTSVALGTDQTLANFAATKLKEQHDRAQPIYDDALKAKALADALNNEVEDLKKKLIDGSGGFDEAINDYKGRADLDVSTHVMIDGKGATELRQKIDDTRKQMLALVAKRNPKDVVGFELPLQALDPKPVAGFPKKDWQNANFGEGIPMAAAMTQLVKIQADTKNAEDAVVKKILGKIEQAVVNLDKFQAVVVAPSSYIISGQQYTAKIFLTAYDSKANPRISVDGSSIPVNAGVGQYNVTASGEGVKTVNVNLSLVDNNGKVQNYTTTTTYEVARPSAVVSPEKMNVLYIGVPNPLAISAPGIPLNKLHLSISQGSVSAASAGHYSANVRTVGTATVTVSGEVSPGKSTTLGSTLFRVKRIPDPKFSFAGRSGGTTSAANIRAQDYVFAKLENFEFDAKFNVTRFTLMVIKPRQDAIIIPGSGNTLSGQMHQVLNTVIPGTTVVFKDITAVGPDGTPRYLDPMVLSAN
jgi:gliding motility-associated protein GldM